MFESEILNIWWDDPNNSLNRKRNLLNLNILLVFHYFFYFFPIVTITSLHIILAVTLGIEMIWKPMHEQFPMSREFDDSEWSIVNFFDRRPLPKTVGTLKYFT